MSGPTPVTISAADRPHWQLRSAVLVYMPTGYAIGQSEGARGVYATVHDIETNGRDFRLKEGKPATREACADLARALGAAATLGGFVPPNLIFLGAKSIIWWRPPGCARIFFDTTKVPAGDQFFDEKGAGRIGKTSGVTAHPGLVFAVAGGRWYVYALPDDRRPEPGTPLLRAPYFNVWASGQICTGNVRLPEKLSTNALRMYEKAFFDSEFTHANVRGRARLVRGDPYEFWKALLDVGTKRPAFPIGDLVLLKLSVEGLAKRLEKDGRIGLDE